MEETYIKLQRANDDVEASALFKTLLENAMAGNPRACYRMGSCHDKAVYVIEDRELAFTWYLRAAELGEVDAMFNLACMYADGDGTALNQAEAVKWYTKAAEKEDVDAMFNLAKLLTESEDPDIKNEHLACFWFVRGAKFNETSSAGYASEWADYLYDISYDKENHTFNVKDMVIEDLPAAVMELNCGDEQELLQYLKPLWLEEYGKAIHVATKENSPLTLSHLCDCISTNREFLFLIDVAIFENTRKA